MKIKVTATTKKETTVIRIGECNLHVERWDNQEKEITFFLKSIKDLEKTIDLKDFSELKIILDDRLPEL